VSHRASWCYGVLQLFLLEGRSAAGFCLSFQTGAREMEREGNRKEEEEAEAQRPMV